LAEPCGWLEARIAGFLEKIVAVSPGRLFSLSFDLPRPVFDVAADARGDRSWLAPEDEVTFFGGGSVSGFDDLDADQWQAACRRWVRLGESKASPIGFLTAPPAPEQGRTKICLPQILLRRNAGRQSVTLIAFRDSAPVAAIARGWMTQFRAMVAPQNGAAAGGVEQVSRQPDVREWRLRVRGATEAIAAGRFAKVVLARKLAVTMRKPIDADFLAREMAHASPDCRIIKLPDEIGCVIAASPELLAVKRGANIVSHALAGTSARFRSPDEDARATARLLASPKERLEHALVVDSIAGDLREICDEVRHAPTPSLMKLRGLQHLWTPVTGTLRPGFGLLEAIDRLHPTPAVLGFPKIAARNWLKGVEERRDGLYTGLAGWIDLDGDGEAAVVLRAAHVEGREAHLWAGAGIMAASDPDAEWAETELKMSALLDLLEGSGEGIGEGRRL
jgi:menaquinone-specific isochorismate synthase